MKHVSLAAVVALVVAGCGPNPPAPVKVMAVAPSQTGAYSTREVLLQTVTSITALKGLVADLIGGARIVIDSTDPVQQLNGGLTNQTDVQRFEAIVKDKGLDVRGNYIERAGVLWPADFDTWNMVTTYYNFELSYAYYTKIVGAQLPEIQHLPVYYQAEAHFESTDALTDNAAYLSVIKSFIVVPQRNDQLIPLAMNVGVIGHEVGHRVFNQRVFSAQGLHPTLGLWTLAPFNLLKSIDEGFADFHGYGVTCSTDTGCRANFLEVSIPDQTVTRIRDVSSNTPCMTESLRSAFKNFSPSQWIKSPEMYQLGNLFAVSMYQTGAKMSGPASVSELQKILINTYDDVDPTHLGLRQLVDQNLNTPAKFTPEAVVNAIASHITDDVTRDIWCGEAANRLQLECEAGSTAPFVFPCTTLPACRGSSRLGTTCKAVPQ